MGDLFRIAYSGRTRSSDSGMQSGIMVTDRLVGIGDSVPVCRLMQPLEGRFLQGHSAITFPGSCGYQRGASEGGDRCSRYFVARCLDDQRDTQRATLDNRRPRPKRSCCPSGTLSGLLRSDHSVASKITTGHGREQASMADADVYPQRMHGLAHAITSNTGPASAAHSKHVAQAKSAAWVLK